MSTDIYVILMILAYFTRRDEMSVQSISYSTAKIK